MHPLRTSLSPSLPLCWYVPVWVAACLAVGLGLVCCPLLLAGFDLMARPLCVSVCV